jgi:hypothetical protein
LFLNLYLKKKRLMKSKIKFKMLFKNFSLSKLKVVLLKRLLMLKMKFNKKSLTLSSNKVPLIKKSEKLLRLSIKPMKTSNKLLKKVVTYQKLQTTFLIKQQSK